MLTKAPKMNFKNFTVPTEEELLQCLGVNSVPFDEGDDEPWIRKLEFSDDACGLAVLSYDVAGRSVKVTYSIKEVQLVSIFHENATELTIARTDGDLVIKALFETSDTIGKLELIVSSRIVISDSMLAS